MIAKTTKYNFNESAGNRLLQGELEKGNRIKTYFSENDKTPNADGYFEVLDSNGIPLKRYIVQIKTVSNLKKLANGYYSYPADTAFLEYVLENIDQNPAVFFIIDIKRSISYFKYLSIEYLLSLKIGCKKTKIIHLNDSDVVNEEQFYSFCVNMIRQRIIKDTHDLTEALLPKSDDLFQYEHIDEGDSTHLYSMPVSPQEGELLRIPSRFFEKYDDIKLIGTGGTSKVFSLTSRITGAKAVLKITSRKDLFMKENVLLHEFKFFDRLRHPAIPRVLDYFIENDTEYMVMDRVEGHTLDELSSQGAFNLAEIIAVIERLCDAVSFLYHSGVLHGDIKPSNILVGKSHKITLLDFGAAELIEDHNNHSLGITSCFTAPEVFSLKNHKTIQSEIYSVGATLYYSLINMKTRKFLRTDLYYTPFDLSEYISNYTGKELGYGLKILKKALAFDPKKRYSNILKMQEDLMIWQKKEVMSPSVLNIALAENRELFYKNLFNKTQMEKNR